jgi:hypothetical protein
MVWQYALSSLEKRNRQSWYVVMIVPENIIEDMIK